MHEDSKEIQAIDELFKKCEHITVTQLDLMYEVFKIHESKAGKNYENYEQLPDTVQEILGSTGYWFSLVLHQLGTDDDIGYVEDMYCGNGTIGHEEELYNKARAILVEKEVKNDNTKND